MLLVCLCAHSMVAQNNGRITYAICPLADGVRFSDVLDTLPGSTDEKRLMNEVGGLIEAATPNLLFELTFSPAGSQFQSAIDVTVNPDADIGMQMAQMMYGGREITFQRPTERVRHLEWDGAPLNVVDTSQIHWTIAPDTVREIANHSCQLAQGTFYAYSRKAQGYTKRTTWAWFAPELPLPYGPNELRGLPGLILAAPVTIGDEYCAVEIALGDQFAPELELLELGKTVTEEEYRQFMEMRVGRRQ